jgi:hypothetical protein
MLQGRLHVSVSTVLLTCLLLTLFPVPSLILPLAHSASPTQPPPDPLALDTALEALDVAADAPALTPGMLDGLLHAIREGADSEWKDFQRGMLASESTTPLSERMNASEATFLPRIERDIARLRNALSTGLATDGAADSLRATLRQAMGQPEKPHFSLEQAEQTEAVAIQYSPAPGANALIPSTAVSRGAPVAADIGQSDDVLLSPEIKVKAAELGNDPLRIYHFVRNTIAFDPYYGGRKGALLTLWEQRGNDVDTASLLIALLRASNYPARYAHGTIVLDAVRAQNWVGGVTPAASLEIAATILSTGGYTATVSGDNQLTVNHTWVEFYPEQRYALYAPLHRNGRATQAQATSMVLTAQPGQARDWIALAPAFKQHTFKAPMSFAALHAIDVEATLDQIGTTVPTNTVLRSLNMIPRQPSTSDPNNPEADVSIIDAQIEQAIAAVDSYLAANPPTSGSDLFGGAAIISEEASSLPDELPFGVLSDPAVVSFSDLPRWLRTFLKIELLSFTRALQVSYEASLPALAGKRISVSYVAANANAQKAIDESGGSILTAPPGTEIVPLIKIDGVEVARGRLAFKGYSYVRKWTITNALGTTFTGENDLDAGDTLVFVPAVGPGSVAAMQRTASELRAALASLPSDANGILDGDHPAVVSEALLGELIQFYMQAYFDQLSFTSTLMARYQGIRSWRGFTMGIGSHRLVYNYFYGQPTATLGSGMAMDVQRGGDIGVSLTGDSEALTRWNAVSNRYGSAFEHGVFEWAGIRALSTMRLLHTALEREVPVYVIDAQNRAQVLPELLLSSSMEELIEQELDQGMTVIVHKEALTLGDWRGAGVILSNPLTGTARNLISGGLASNFTMAAGGSFANFWEEAAFFAGFALAAVDDIINIAQGTTLIMGAGPLGAGLGMLKVAEGAYGLAEAYDEYAAARREGQTDPNAGKKYFGEQVFDTGLSKIVDYGSKSLRDAVRETFTGERIDKAFEQIDRLTGGKASEWADKGVTKANIVDHWIQNKDPRGFQEMIDFTEQINANTANSLIEGASDYAYEKVEWARASNNSQNGEGKTTMAGEMAGGSRDAAYGFQRASTYSLPLTSLAATGTINRYRPSVTVSYQPVIGFDTTGKPIRGAVISGTLTADFVYNDTIWVDTFYHPIRPNDLRYWNRKAMISAALNDGTITQYRLQAAGTIPSALRNWSVPNGIKIAYTGNLEDWFGQ